MPVSPSLLRLLAEQHDYSALHEACLSADSSDPGVQVLLALACAHLGNEADPRTLLASLDQDTLTLGARVDLAAVHIALGELDLAIDTLESARRELARREFARREFARREFARRECAEPEDADHALLLARLAWCRLQQGRQPEALALYEQSLSLRPFLAVYHSLLRLYRDSGRLSDMKKCLDAAWLFWAEEQPDWPAELRQIHNRQLRDMQLDLWLARERFEAAEDWVERQRDTLDEADWCVLVSGLAQRLAAGDRHAQAEEWLRAGLRRYPEHLELYGQLAELAQLQGRTRQALALLRRAIQLAGAQNEPTDLLWTRLSATALQSHPGLARQAAEQARDQLDRETGQNTSCADEAHAHSPAVVERRLQVQLALASVEAQEQDFSTAEQRYRQVLEQRPQMIAALQGLGQLLMQLGRIDEAVALFERIRVIDPTRGHGALINARRFPEDVDILHRLEGFARKPGMEGSVRSGLLFQLASAWEKREDYDKAFALAEEANTATRRLLRYDPRAHRQRCARIRHAFPGALFERRSGCGHESNLPVFVVGMPRSGTTLVEQIIAGHSRIHGAGELGTIPRVIAGLERWERHTGSGRRYPDCVDDLDPDVTRGIAENVLKELREYAQEKTRETEKDTGKPADKVVDKLPHNFENIGLIRLLFPRAKIISVRRDPRDIAISNYLTDYAGKHGGMGFAYDLDWIGEQLADHNLLMHHWQQLFPGGILEISYEDVVDDPETSARRMLEHIGVDWEPQVLDFNALQRPVKTASVWQVRQPLYASSKSRWQRYQQHLKPLIAGTNRKITWDPIEMVTLPEPGWLNAGVDRYRQGDLDAAEYRFKQLLHYLPEHAAARFMLGLVYMGKRHHGEGIALMEQALERCPWNRDWRNDLARAYRLDGRDQDAAALATAGDNQTAPLPEACTAEEPPIHLDYLFLSGESKC